MPLVRGKDMLLVHGMMSWNGWRVRLVAGGLWNA
jgi:hypothetical protein